MPYTVRNLDTFLSAFSLADNEEGRSRAQDMMTYMSNLVLASNLDLSMTYGDMPIHEKKRLANLVKLRYPDLFRNVTAVTTKRRTFFTHSFMGMAHCKLRAKRRKRQNRIDTDETGTEDKVARLQDGRKSPKKSSNNAITEDKENSGGALCVNQVYMGRRQFAVVMPPLKFTKKRKPAGLMTRAMTLKKRAMPMYTISDAPTSFSLNGSQSNQTKVWRNVGMHAPSGPSSSLHRVPQTETHRPDTTISTSGGIRNPVSRGTVVPPRETATETLPAQVESPAVSRPSIQNSLTRHPVPDTMVLPPRETAEQPPATVPEPQLSTISSHYPRPPHSQIRTNVTEIAELRHFLSRCEPPMSRYLAQFLAVGCRNKQYLRAVSKFPEPMLKEFIDSLADSDDDRRMTITEKFILRAWFVEYFRGT